MITESGWFRTGLVGASLGLALALFSCNTPSSGLVYQEHEGGRVLKGTVIEMNPAIVEKDISGLAFAGGSAGVIIGSDTGDSTGAHAAGALAGAVIGRMVGAGAERLLSRRKGWELLIAADDGYQYVFPVVDPHPFVLHEPVRLVMGDFGKPERVEPLRDLYPSS